MDRSSGGSEPADADDRDPGLLSCQPARASDAPIALRGGEPRRACVGRSRAGSSIAGLMGKLVGAADLNAQPASQQNEAQGAGRTDAIPDRAETEGGLRQLPRRRLRYRIRTDRVD